MRILLTVQRYHPDLVGGSESAARGYAENLARHGHDVEVVTSCATSHHDWANNLPSGIEEVNGVTVHRLPVSQPRRDDNFGPIHRRSLSPLGRLNRSEARLWLSRIGPEIPGLERWLDRNATRFDVALVMTYMYPTTTRSLPVLHRRCPTVFVPTAHDEPALHLSPFRSLFHLPDAFGFLTPEERDLVTVTFAPNAPGEVIGVGVDPVPTTDPGDFRKRFLLGDDPYVVIVGRVDAAKGTYEALEMFRAFKEHNPGPLRLVLVGERVESTTDDVIATGFCSDLDKHRALAGASALIQPSYMESFSIVLCEAWAHGLPVLVNGHCSVTRGQVERSRGGVAYRSFSEFDAALDTVLSHPDIALRAGANGKRYVDSLYGWSDVVARIEGLADTAVSTHRSRRALS